MKTANFRFVWTVGLLGLGTAAMAAEPARVPTHPQEPVGFVSGAVIGAFAGGPVGAVVGAGIGTWLGNRVHRAGDTAKAEARVAVLERAAVVERAAALQRAAEAQRAVEVPIASPQPMPASAMNAEVLDGLQGDILFRTGSAEITPEIAHQVQVLAQAVTKSTALKVRIDGYADPRGSDAFNMQLSQDRAYAVRDLLLAAGVSAQVVELNAYGKTQSVAQDHDGFALESRVRVTLQAENSGALVSVSAIGLR